MHKVYKLSLFLLLALTLTGLLSIASFYGESIHLGYFTASISRIVHNAAALSLLLLAFCQLFLFFWFDVSKRKILFALGIFVFVVLCLQTGLAFNWEMLTHHKIYEFKNLGIIAIPKDEISIEIQQINGVAFFRKKELLIYAVHCIVLPLTILLGLILLKKTKHSKE